MGLEPELAKKVRLEIDKYKDREEGTERLELEKMDFSRNTCICLKRSGIQSLTDLSNITEEELRKVRNLGKKAYDEVVAKMSEYGISFKAKEGIEEHQQILEKDREEGPERFELEKMNFSRRAYVCLIRSGIQSLTDLSNITEEELRKIRNLGKKAYDEVVDKMNEYGISFKSKEGIEQSKVVENDDQQQEKNNDMIPEQLQDTINQKNIESNKKQIKEDTEKSELIQKVIKQQEIINVQEEEIKRLKKILGTQQQ